jgi:hypothetical protein
MRALSGGSSGEPPDAPSLRPEQIVPRKRAVRKSRQSSHAAPPALAPSAHATPAHSPHAHPRARRPPPYIQCLQRTGRVAVWQVDGAYVRKQIDSELGAFGHHYSFSAIPRNEIWIDAEQSPDDQPLLIRQAAIERRLMARGMDYEAARTVAIAEERHQRMKSAGPDDSGGSEGTTNRR